MKLEKPEIIFVKFNQDDVITTSGGRYNFSSKNEDTPSPDSKAENKNFLGISWDW